MQKNGMMGQKERVRKEEMREIELEGRGDGRKRMNRVIMAQCESCCRKRERLSEEENKMRLRALRQIELDTPQRFSVCVRVFV